MKISVLGLIVLTFFSCKENMVREFYVNGNIEKEYILVDGKIEGDYRIYDEHGQLREVHIYEKGKRKDSSVYYFESGGIRGIDIYKRSGLIYRKDFENPKSEGFINKSGFVVGKWKHYGKNGKLQEIREFKNIRGEPYLNQNWLFDENQDTILISDKSSHYKLTFFQDTISLKNSATGLVDLYDPLFDKNDPDIMVVLPKNGSANFNGDFSNIDEVETDTIYNLNIERHYREAAGIGPGDYSTLAFFGRYFTTPGTKKFRGIIVEFYNVDPDSVAADGMRLYKHNKYFEHTVFVKDTVEQN